MQFRNSSLDSLVKNLSDIDFRYLLQQFSDEFLKLINEKGVYLYEYMNNFKRFFDDKLVHRGKFYSSSKDERVNDKDHLHVVNVWNMFEMKIMGDYHDLYLKTDVLLLADVFQKFIGVCLEY